MKNLLILCISFIGFIFPFFRYGLPVNFCSVVLKPHRKSQKKTEDVLKDLYGYLDSKFVANEADVSIDSHDLHVVHISACM